MFTDTSLVRLDLIEMTRRILIIEDDEPIRRGMVDALTFAGY